MSDFFDKKIDCFSLKAGNIVSLFTILSIAWKETEIELTELNSVDIKAGLKLKKKHVTWMYTGKTHSRRLYTLHTLYTYTIYANR